MRQAEGLCGGRITPEELDELSARHPQGNFQETSHMMELARRHGSEVEAVGVRRGGALVAGCFVAYGTGRLGTTGSIWCGPLCDLHDRELAAALTGAIRDSAKAHHAVSVSCWPDFVYQLHDSEGTPVGEPDQASFDTLADLGWEHGGFQVGYATVCHRWVYVKDLTGIGSEQELLDSYAKYRRRNIRIARESYVGVRPMGRDEMGLFQRLCDMSSEKQGFEGRGAAYYEDLFDVFGDDVQFRVAEIDLARYRAHWEEKLAHDRASVAATEARIAQGRANPKAAKHLEALRAEVDGAERRLTEADELIARDGELVPIGCICYLYHEREVVGLSAGNDERYARFYASALLHHLIMVDAVARGIGRYNFYGISGIFDKDDPSYGVYEFKTRFNGYVEEMPGEFTLPVDPLRHGAKRLAGRLLGRLGRA